MARLAYSTNASERRPGFVDIVRKEQILDDLNSDQEVCEILGGSFALDFVADVLDFEKTFNIFFNPCGHAHLGPVTEAKEEYKAFFNEAKELRDKQGHGARERGMVTPGFPDQERSDEIMTDVENLDQDVVTFIGGYSRFDMLDDVIKFEKHFGLFFNPFGREHLGKKTEATAEYKRFFSRSCKGKHSAL